MTASTGALRAVIGSQCGPRRPTGRPAYSVDATKDGRLGRLINHSRASANLVTRIVLADSVPRLTFWARRDIAAGEELLYDYGDRSRAALASHPWLAT